MKNQPRFKTTLLVLTSCLSLGFASCSTTKQIAPSSTNAHPKPINHNSAFKDTARHVADETLVTVGTVTGIAGAAAFYTFVIVVGGIYSAPDAVYDFLGGTLPE